MKEEAIQRARQTGESWDLMLQMFTQKELIDILKITHLHRYKKRVRKKKFRAFMHSLKICDMLRAAKGEDVITYEEKRWVYTFEEKETADGNT